MCDFGKLIRENCEKSTVKLSHPTREELQLLQLRSKSKLPKTVTICHQHKLTYLTLYASNQKKCCDPFKKHQKQVVKRIREISLETSLKFPRLDLKPGQKVCSNCVKLINAQKCTDTTGSSLESESDSSMSSFSLSSQMDSELEMDGVLQTDIALLNESIQSIGESPINLKKVKFQKQYSQKKFEKIQGTVRKRLRMAEPEEEFEECTEESYFNEIILQLKEKFNSSQDRSSKIQVLTVLPKSWSIRKVMKVFGVPNYMARKAKLLVAEKGILSTPNPKPGFPTPVGTIKLVEDYYLNDDISRAMAGIKDCVSMIVDGKKQSVNKRLLLCNLKEAYIQYKNQYPGLKIGFTKFASLRPKNVVLPGSSGTHSVCVCTIHQNVKLMLEGSKLCSSKEFKPVIAENYHGTVSYKHLLAHLACNPAQPKCFLGLCEECGNINDLKRMIMEVFEEKLLVDSITYKAWVSVDRSHLETLIKPLDEFVECLFEKLLILQRHDFIAKQQSASLNQMKQQIDGSVIILGDFAENYSFIVQDAAQSYHWTNMQATIHPFVIYHNFPTAEDPSTSLKHICLAIISDTLQHNTVTVHTFQHHLFKYLQTFKFPVKKAVYFTDGAASQYKNRKNFINLCHHESDFGIPAEWHFFATSHGKGPCDGVGGTIKRLAAKASLQRVSDDHIQTPKQLFVWAEKSLTKVKCLYVEHEEIKRHASDLEERFSYANPIPGTQKLHFFEPLTKSTEKLIVKEYSLSSNFSTVTINNKRSSKILQWEEITSYVTCVYEKNWWLAYVLKKFMSNDELELKFLHPHGPVSSFSFPRKDDVLIVPRSSLLTSVDPQTTSSSGRTYFLTDKELLHAEQMLALKLQ